jgi:hypothetical protein
LACFRSLTLSDFDKRMLPQNAGGETVPREWALDFGGGNSTTALDLRPIPAGRDLR